MIYAIKLSLKIVRKAKITYLLNKTFLFFPEQKYLFFKFLEKWSQEFNCLGIIFVKADTKNVENLKNVKTKKFRTLLSDLTEPKCHKTKHQLVTWLKLAMSTFEIEPSKPCFTLKSLF